MNQEHFYFEAMIHKVPDLDGAYVIFPHDVRQVFGKGRVKVRTTFDGIPYEGSIVNMGMKNPDGSICYILGMPKALRKALGKGPGQTVQVTIKEREE